VTQQLSDDGTGDTGCTRNAAPTSRLAGHQWRMTTSATSTGRSRNESRLAVPLRRESAWVGVPGAVIVLEGASWAALRSRVER
jgi:hypothetical protein